MSEDRLAAAERLLGLKVLECDALRARIWRLEGYVEHRASCPLQAGHSIEACDCGLVRALVGQPERVSDATCAKSQTERLCLTHER